ncbi:hypothetical protein L9F63_008319, partial [Diploptera punctata]
IYSPIYKGNLHISVLCFPVLILMLRSFRPQMPNLLVLFKLSFSSWRYGLPVRRAAFPVLPFLFSGSRLVDGTTIAPLLSPSSSRGDSPVDSSVRFSRNTEETLTFCYLNDLSGPIIKCSALGTARSPIPWLII